MDTAQLIRLQKLDLLKKNCQWTGRDDCKHRQTSAGIKWPLLFTGHKQHHKGNSHDDDTGA